LGVQETPSAEFGVKGGAPINMIMKSGTNAFHGTAQYLRHTNFADADNYFANHGSDNCATPGECRPTQLRNQQFGGTIGGPIVKDKTFFFLYYEAQRYVSTATKTVFVPTTAEIDQAISDINTAGLTVSQAGQNLLSYFPSSASGTLVTQVPTTDRMDGFGVKVDHKVTNHISASGRYIFGDSLQAAPPFAGLAPSSSHPQDLFDSVAPSRTQMAGLSVTWTGTNKVLESRFGWTRFAQIIDVNNKVDPKSLGIDTGPLASTDFGIPYVYLAPLGYGGYIGGVQGYPITTRPDQTYDWSEHFSLVKGNHSIRVGGNYQTAYTNSLRNRARTGLAFGYTFDPVKELLLGKAELADRNFGDTHRHITQKSVGLYAQDDWKIKPNFTLTYGLRWELNGAIGERNDLGANFIPGKGLVTIGKGIDRLYNLDKSDFGPRLGFAWDIFGNGKTALRGGYSLTYDVPNFGALAAPYSLAHARAGAFTQPLQGNFSSNGVTLSGNAGVDPANPASTCVNPDDPNSGGDYVCFGNGPVFGSSPSGTPPFNAFSMVNNLKTPRAHDFNLSIQREIVSNQVLSLTYSGSRGRDLLLYQDINASPLGSAGDFTDRPYSTQFPELNHIVQATNRAASQYDSFQATFNQHNWHGLNLEYNYTWSKCFDNNSVNRGGAGDYPQINNTNPVGSTAPGFADVRDSRGLCDHDVRHNFNLSGLYTFPTAPVVPKLVGSGWAISTVYTALSGRPFSALVGGGQDVSGQGLDGNSLRAAYDGTPIHYNRRNPDAYVVESYTALGQADPCADNFDTTLGDFAAGAPLSPFFAPCTGQVGNSRRNQLIGPGLSQWDATVLKDTKISERLTVQFRWEVFNVLNRANFKSIPNNTLNGNFGVITSTPDVFVGNPVIAQGGARNMNFALKIIF
jgi:hypothetical protein